MFKRCMTSLREVALKVALVRVAPTNAQIQLMLFMAGVGLLSVGLVQGAHAQGLTTLDQNFNDSMIAEVVITILRYLRGAFGALVMVVAGISAIVSAAFGQYRAALGLLVVAIGAFVLNSLVVTFFNSDELNSELPNLG